MADVEKVDALRAGIAAQAEQVKSLKASGAAKEDIIAAVGELKSLRAQLAEHADAATEAWPVDMDTLDTVRIRRMFVVPSFEIHSGVAGLFDFGPPGCGMKEALLAMWREHFVLEESMLQLECSTLTPEKVLATSGHVEKFVDLMVKDTKTGECYRADKLLEDAVEQLLADPANETMLSAERERWAAIARQADAYTPAELHEHLTSLSVVSPGSGAPLTEPFPFNLMFPTSIGPAGNSRGFLRPETAQGMFVNFRRLLDYNNGRLPMAAAQVGTAYRNEIAPRGGLLRVREFTMAEIEHFLDESDKAHPKFDRVAGLTLTLFPADNQVSDGKTRDITLGEAVSAGIIANQTLAYFMGRTAQFLARAGVKRTGVRFRQHLRNEMAHYACDCWDAEILMSSGWVECVGHADRACYDLQVHADASNVDMHASRRLPEPISVTEIVPKVARAKTGKVFRADNAAVCAELEALATATDAASVAARDALMAGESTELTVNGTTFTVSPDMVKYKSVTKTVQEEKFMPHVIEPSFGVGRIMEAVFQHCFYVRPEESDAAPPAEGGAAAASGDKKKTKKKKGEDKIARAVFAFPPALAPFKAAVFGLDQRIDKRIPDALGEAMKAVGMSVIVDQSSVSIGRRYARVDELGVPFAVTVDFDTASTGAVTLRERDSGAQVYVQITAVPRVIADLVQGARSWSDVTTEFEVKLEGTPLPDAARTDEVTLLTADSAMSALQSLIGAK